MTVPPNSDVDENKTAEKLGGSFDLVPVESSTDSDSGDGEGQEDPLERYGVDGASGPGTKLGDPIEARPYIHISPAREQVTPGNVVNGLFGLYRAGVTSTSRFNLRDRLGLKDYKKTFDFIVHKPRNTKRFDFYLSVTPYDATAFKTLAANVAAMYPESFEFEIVPFNSVAAFASDDGNARVGGRRIASLDDILDLENLAGFEDPDIFVDHDIGQGHGPTAEEAEEQLLKKGVPLRPEDVPPEKRPSLVRWKGIVSKKNDWMTLLQPFTDIAVDTDDQYRSPLSVLLEQAVHTDDPFVFQATFKPRKDWTSEAEVHKRNLKMGNHGTLSAFKNEAARQLFGTSEQERRNIHRGDISEQVGGSVTAGDNNKIAGSRMAQIDHKQPTTTFDLTLRAACNEQTIQSISNAFTSLSGSYYGLEGEILGRDDKEFARLCHSRLAGSGGLSGRFSRGDPLICVSPDELANFVVVPHTDALPRASRGSSGGSPDARSPLTATDEEMLSQYDSGMLIGYAETAVDNSPDIPIRLSAEQLTHHVLRAATTGGGKTTAMVNDALSAYDAFDGPVFVFDKKGGTMSEEYKRAHVKRFGTLDEVLHIPVPGPNEDVLAFPYFDIRPQLAAGVSRTVAVQEKIDRYNELLVYVLGREMTQQAFVAQEILNNLIKAKFDPVHGKDAWPIKELFDAASDMQDGIRPRVSDETVELTLQRHLEADERRFQTSIDAVMNRITKLAERDFIWRVLNFVPEWNEEKGGYAEQSPMFDIQEILASNKVIIIDTGDLRPASSNLFTFLLLDYIWSGAQLRHRLGNTPPVGDGYVINLIIDEAAPLLQSDLVRNDMIPEGREFGLALEVIVHFAEQVKSDALDVSSYKEILRNINTKLIGKLAVDDELVMTLFHEGIENEELVERITSLPRGEWVAQLPDTGFMTDVPELVTLLPVGIPDGHSDSDEPLTDDTVSIQGYTFAELKAEVARVTGREHCLLPGSNTEPSGEQLATEHRRGHAGSNVGTREFERKDRHGNGNGTKPGVNPQTQFGTGGSIAPDDVGADTKTNGHGASSESTADLIPEDDLPDDVGSHRPASKPESDVANRDGQDVDEEVASGLGDRVNEFLDGGVETNGDDALESADTQSESADENGASGEDEQSRNESDDEDGDEARSGIDEDLTVEERHFLSALVTTVNGNHPAFDIIDSMERIRSQFDDVDEEKLIDLGYLEKQTENLRVYYSVTRDGQRACGAKVATGEDQGDVNEKTYHKVMVEAFARSLARDSSNQHFVKKYTPLYGTDVKPDVVAYDGEDPAILGEAISNVDHKLIVKHYDDFNRFDVEKKVWIVPNLSEAWNISRALANAERIDELPAKRRGKSHADLTREVWGEDGDWEFVSAAKLLNDLD
jgi:DNA helicase HerA-like ATPase